MRLLIFQIALGGIALVGGWQAGVFSMPNEVTPKLAGKRPESTISRSSSVDPTWKRRLSAVSNVVGAASGTAWTKWAWTVPDAEIPQAIESLNPQIHFQALDALYCRWVKLDLEKAWESFRKSSIPESTSSLHIPEYSDITGCVVLRPGFNGMSQDQRPRYSIAEHMSHSCSATEPTRCLKYFQQFEVLKYAELASTGFPEDIVFSASNQARKAQAPKLIRSENLAEDTQKAFEKLVRANLFFDQPLDPLSSPTQVYRPEEILSDYLRQWLQNDFNAALTWVKTRPEENRYSLESDVIDFLPESASFGARLDMLRMVMQGHEDEGMGIGGSIMGKARLLVQQWVNEYPEAASAYLKAMPESELQIWMVGGAAAELVGSDPDAAIAMIDGLEGDSSQAFLDLVRGWTTHDATACLAWLERLPQGELSDSGFEMVAGLISEYSPMAGVEAALKISNPSRREQSLESRKEDFRWNPKLRSEAIQAHPELGWK